MPLDHSSGISSQLLLHGEQGRSLSTSSIEEYCPPLDVQESLFPATRAKASSTISPEVPPKEELPQPATEDEEDEEEEALTPDYAEARDRAEPSQPELEFLKSLTPSKKARLDQPKA
jgi:hypothetical protein